MAFFTLTLALRDTASQGSGVRAQGQAGYNAPGVDSV